MRKENTWYCEECGVVFYSDEEDVYCPYCYSHEVSVEEEDEE